MRLSCLQENLNLGLSIVGRAVATRTTYPVMQNVLIKCDDGRLKLTATNQEIAISTWIGAQIEEDGALTVPARLLTEFVSSLPAERIDLTDIDQPVGLSMSCARFDAQINGTAADEFPPIPSVDSGIVARVDSKTMSEAIEHVVIAAATEDSRPVLTGIKVELSGDQFTFAAADGFRLAVYKGKLEESISEDVDFIVPARALQDVSRLIGGTDDPVEFTVTQSKSQALFKLNNIEIVANLLQGTFPNYSQLIPADFGSRAIVDLEEFTRATRAASIFARDGSGIVRLVIDSADNGSGKISIQSKSEEIGENQSELDADVEGEGDSKIAFSSKYLTDVLSILETKQVVLEVTGPSSPGVLKPLGRDNYVHVVMPIFVRW